jgi:hypothetical protein
MTVDKMTVAKMIVDKMTVDRMTVNKMSADMMSLDEMTVDIMSADMMSLDEMSCCRSYKNAARCKMNNYWRATILYIRHFIHRKILGDSSELDPGVRTIKTFYSCN